MVDGDINLPEERHPCRSYFKVDGDINLPEERHPCRSHFKVDGDINLPEERHPCRSKRDDPVLILAFIASMPQRVCLKV
jgi:hypothetical protein